MSYVVITSREREELVELFFKLRKKGELHPHARAEALTALRCLKAVHSNAIEDKKVDRIFLQVLLHGAGVEDKSLISNHYNNASHELRGQEKILRSLEEQAGQSTPFSLSMLLEMHHGMFEKSWPDTAGRFRQGEVRIADMAHRPPHYSKVQEQLYQSFASINDRLFAIKEVTPEIFFEILQLSAEVHYLVAQVHPFEDGNGRVARAAGDYAMLVHGFYYDVIMQDYRSFYLDAMSESSTQDTAPLRQFLEYSYLETLRRIAGFFELIENENR
ncbi:Fic family protein [Akkermansiaceae bacterium]|nr:Fic family protein [Akkermansiaceae bacterium]MDB4423557.1 Fic family protein [bacterium]MDB4464728.1 Fic family protein [Akkermansiaceae bacterium]MDB4809526.1 Fic family protein [bacterium]